MAQLKKEDDLWELYYWDGRGRGQYVRILFADADVKFKEINNPQAIGASFGGGKDLSFPPFAVPAVKKGDVVLGQTDVIVRYLSRELGLCPKDPLDEAHGAQILANIQDIGAEVRQHKDDKKEDLVKFLEGRFDTWLSVLERPLKIKKGQEFYFGDKCSFADLSVFCFMYSVNVMYGKYYEDYVTKKHPALNDHFKRIGQRKGVKNLYDNDGRKEYMGDIFAQKLAQN